MKEGKKKVCVIGAGASGLSAIKACLEEDIDVKCYDQSDYLGGLWRYRDADVDGLASVTKLTTINSSKEMSCFSDFPPNEMSANFMHHSSMLNYFKSYAQTFGLEEYIKFNHYIESLQPNDDYTKTGRWRCKIKSLQDDQRFEEVFDAVMVCTGHHVKPHIPTFTGQDKFAGTIIHTHSIKNSDNFRDKRIVVVGLGNSGGDAAVEIANVAKQVYLSTRRGAWILRRSGEHGYPFDADMNRRYYKMLFKLVPFSLACGYMESMLNKFFDHEMYRLKPKHRVFSQHPCVNDFLPLYILNGAVKVKTNISTFTQNGVIFEGEDRETECDAVILATGYEISFPFLDKSIIDPSENRLRLYKYMFPPEMEHPETLSFIGYIQSVGAIIPISEQQSRWAVQLLKGNCKLPNVECMMQDIIQKQKQQDKRYYHSQRHTLEVDFIDFMDEITSQFGAKPNLLKYAIHDPRLFYHLIVDPCTPYQYRLNGPNQWAGARKAIIEVEKRIHAPFKTKAQ